MEDARFKLTLGESSVRPCEEVVGGPLLPGFPGLTGITVQRNWTHEVHNSHVEKQKPFG